MEEYTSQNGTKVTAPAEIKIPDFAGIAQGMLTNEKKKIPPMLENPDNADGNGYSDDDEEEN